MCGFVGFFGGEALRGSAGYEALLRPMAGAIRHRGPDDEGFWCDPEARIGLGHRRLSIVDLSPAGHQPMLSPSGRYAIAFNGEIYNHANLRKELEKSGGPRQWRGHSDTETFLAGFDDWGIRKTLERAVGMFAFAAWDRQARTLTLARDRAGEKPCYYGWTDGLLLFGSELSALRKHPRFKAPVDRGALSLLLRHNYIPAPWSIYQGIRKLLPGTLVAFSLDRPDAEPESYWSGVEAAIRGVANPFAGGDQEAVERLEALLREAVGMQMVADVPLGAFLSGGVDSSAVVALMQAQSGKPVRTFTIGFEDPSFNEAKHAAQVASHLGTDHTELYVTPEQARAVIPRLPDYYSEPFSDSSQIPTFLVSELARRHVTVSLSGDAGDELFSGYNRYRFTSELWKKLSRCPLPLRRLLSHGLSAVPVGAWNRAFGLFGRLLPDSLRTRNFGDKIHKGAGVLGHRTADELYLRLISHWEDPASVVLDGAEPPTLLTGLKPGLGALSDVERMMALDLLTYLPDDILVKVDRAAMSVSLESRVPFLDHRVMEFAWTLPMALKIRGGATKWILRQVLYRYVPRELIERPKMGFAIPVDAWLRGPLREWTGDLIDPVRLRREGFFRPGPIAVKWEEHRSGKRNWGNYLWDVLMFQAWLERQ